MKPLFTQKICRMKHGVLPITNADLVIDYAPASVPTLPSTDWQSGSKYRRTQHSPAENGYTSRQQVFTSLQASYFPISEKP